MSWDVELVKDGNPVVVNSHQEGTIIACGGMCSAEMGITYNYSALFRDALGFGFREMNGERAGDVIPQLEKAVVTLGTEKDHDYWAATPGNAGHALSVLLGWCKQHPDATIEIV